MNGNNTNGNSNGNGNGHGSRWWPLLRGRERQTQQHLGPYRRLAMQLHYDLPRPGSSRTVLLATPGTSTLCARSAATLACCLAEELHRPVLLVDACPKQPEATRLLAAGAVRGFSDLLLDLKLPLSEWVVPTTHEHVSFLPAGAATGHPPIHNLNALLSAAEREFDFVVLSGGAVLQDSTALALAPHVGCVLLLAIENETVTDDLDAAQDTLTFCKARKIGLVFTTPVGSKF